MDLLGRISRAVAGFLARFGIYFFATRQAVAIARRSPREQPELINRALWRPFVVDDEWWALYKQTQALTGETTDSLLRQCRFYSTFQWAAHTAALPEGDVVECGCWHGHSTVAIATVLRDRSFRGRFHVFDSFEGGLSDFTLNDESFFALSEDEKQEWVKTFASSYDSVRSLTEPFGFVDLHKGWIPEVFTGFHPRPIRFVHIDVDMFEPTKASLEFFWPHLVDGGVMICDDYNYSMFEGANRAVDGFLASARPSIVYKVPLGTIVIIK
jgi:O-methyltransferase